MQVNNKLREGSNHVLVNSKKWFITVSCINSEVVREKRRATSSTKEDCVQKLAASQDSNLIIDSTFLGVA
jgi:hypothetical protein